VLFFFLVVSVLGAPELQTRIVAVTTESVSPAVGDIIEVMNESQTDAGPESTVSASIVGVPVLVWGSIKVFRGLDTAFSEIYGTTGS
jgi:membrane protein